VKVEKENVKKQRVNRNSLKKGGFSEIKGHQPALQKDTKQEVKSS
jgi:hypothetical protein